MNPLMLIKREVHLIKRHYNFIECKIIKSTLYCYGSYQPTPESIVYHYRIKYTATGRPNVTLVTPQIEYNDDIHMYPRDKSLCLYHKSDLVWDEKCHLFDTIIPWTHEWFVFYELYLLTGRWHHPYVPHKKEDKQ